MIGAALAGIVFPVWLSAFVPRQTVLLQWPFLMLSDAHCLRLNNVLALVTSLDQDLVLPHPGAKCRGVSLSSEDDEGNDAVKGGNGSTRDSLFDNLANVAAWLL